MFLWQESPADCGGPGRRHRADLKLRFSMFGKLCMDTMDTMDMAGMFLQRNHRACIQAFYQKPDVFLVTSYLTYEINSRKTTTMRSWTIKKNAWRKPAITTNRVVVLAGFNYF